MEELFGIPMERLMWGLLAVFAVAAFGLGVSAFRNLVVFKMAVRNIPRRKSQSALIVLGLMLATMLFSASFTTGDTLTNSLRTQELLTIGQVDVVIKAEETGASDQQGMASATRKKYFDQGLVENVRDRLADDEEVAAVAPLAAETVPVISRETDLSEPAVDVLGMDAGSMEGFDRLTDKSSERLSLHDLAKNQAYISEEAAAGLDVGKGDELEVSLGPRPAVLEVADVYEKGGNPASETSMVVPLDELQELTGNEGQINEVLITHTGPVVEGGAHTDATVAALKPLLAANDLGADPVKKDALEEADEAGAQFSTIFLLLGQFSIAAGILLIFLIFVMIAAERKRELGIARAVGMQREHVVRMFAFEGAVYALLSSGIGSVLGVGIGWAMVRIIGAAATRIDEFEISFAAKPHNVVMAFAMGMVLTYLVVLLASWRVSRLNVVRAIRDIPEPDRKGRTVKGILLALLTPVAGALLIWQGFDAKQMGVFLLGNSLLIIGVALVARLLRVPDRVAFTLASLALLALWLAPARLWPERISREMSQGVDLFFISGIVTVIAGVWLAVYNSDLLLRAIVALFGRIRGLPPVLKTAVSYPMQNRFRTGMTLAMFSLVVFTLVTMSLINKSLAGTTEDTDRLTGGYDIRADAGYAAPISDMDTALEEAKGVNEDGIAAVGSVSGLPTRAKQKGTDREPKDLYVQGVDRGYIESVGYGFDMMAKEYDSEREVWRALQEEPDVAVISSSLVPSRSSTLGAPPPPIELGGFYLEDGKLPEDLYIQARDPPSGEERDLRVIGVMESTAFTTFFAGNVTTSQKTLDSMAAAPIPPQTYMFELEDGVEAGTMAKSLERGFAQNGLQTQVMSRIIEDSTATTNMFNNLIVGFMGLGLLVGIAALGVIAARSVVERRQQIGMLRALGFQRGQVRLSFLLESSFIALLGIGIGVALGGALSANIVDAMKADFEGISYQVPWATIGVVVTAAYAASFLTTYLPARQASKVYPAEALRYDE